MARFYFQIVCIVLYIPYYLCSFSPVSVIPINTNSLSSTDAGSSPSRPPRFNNDQYIYLQFPSPHDQSPSSASSLPTVTNSKKVILHLFFNPNLRPPSNNLDLNVALYKVRPFTDRELKKAKPFEIVQDMAQLALEGFIVKNFKLDFPTKSGEDEDNRLEKYEMEFALPRWLEDGEFLFEASIIEKLPFLSLPILHSPSDGRTDSPAMESSSRISEDSPSVSHHDDDDGDANHILGKSDAVQFQFRRTLDNGPHTASGSQHTTTPLSEPNRQDIKLNELPIDIFHAGILKEVKTLDDFCNLCSSSKHLIETCNGYFNSRSRSRSTSNSSPSESHDTSPSTSRTNSKSRIFHPQLSHLCALSTIQSQAERLEFKYTSLQSLASSSNGPNSEPALYTHLKEQLNSLWQSPDFNGNGKGKNVEDSTLPIWVHPGVSSIVIKYLESKIKSLIEHWEEFYHEIEGVPNLELNIALSEKDDEKEKVQEGWKFEKEKSVMEEMKEVVTKMKAIPSQRNFKTGLKKSLVLQLPEENAVRVLFKNECVIPKFS
ncbi:hypothetical protein BKA69DRAFT_1046315, partial [Paraphysoderma sedebokerense]